jgi:hypothetical protein
MPRRVKDFVEISDYTSLDQLINTLTAIRDSLPPEAEPELKLKGDDIFGRRISICYFRELTEEEASLDARYNPAELPAADAAIEALRGKLDSIPYSRAPKARIRRVA